MPVSSGLPAQRASPLVVSSSRGLAFILVDQRLKLSCKIWVGCADRQALEKHSPLMQLPASRWLINLQLARPTVALPALYMLSRADCDSILERNRMRSRQEKPAGGRSI